MGIWIILLRRQRQPGSCFMWTNNGITNLLPIGDAARVKNDMAHNKLSKKVRNFKIVQRENFYGIVKVFGKH